MQTSLIASIARRYLGAFTLIAGATAYAATSATPAPPNVLFIAVDDLRPQMKCYGDPIAVTPNMDALAARGTLFMRAYCQQAVCAPSRASVMTGRRPDSTRVFDLKTHFRRALPDVVTMPSHFRQHGYVARSIGKIYHSGLDDPESWSTPPYEEISASTVKRKVADRGAASPDLPTTATTTSDSPSSSPSAWSQDKPRTKLVKGRSWEIKDVEDSELRDGQIADGAIAMLREEKDRPFFLAVGFIKPHLPFVAPRKYYDLYPPEKIQLSKHPEPTRNAPSYAFTNFGELRGYTDMPSTGPITDDKARELTRGYYAAMSYADAQIGRVLTELERLGLRDRTIVVLWGDHGWHLGDLGHWCKHTNFEFATRTALIFSVPGQKSKGAKSDALVELVDIYPTLCELAGLPNPAGLEGSSLVGLFSDPDKPWKKAAFSQYPRSGVMGYSMRTDRYRYTEWRNTKSKAVVAAELYDHAVDPAETNNIAGEKESADLLKRLSGQLQSGWIGAKPR